MKRISAYLLIIMSVLLTATNSNAMPTVSDVILSPFKAVAKPFTWWRYGYENKTDEYKVEITYNLELDGKPLTFTKAINCEIYEGVFRSDNNGKKKPTRKVWTQIRQITHEIEETNEVLILPVPGHCKVDEPFRVEEDQNGKSKIIPIKNQTKDFIPFPADWIPSYSVIKFQKNALKQIDRAEIAISPKYKESPNTRVKIKSFTTKAESKESPISKDTELLTVEKDSRFYFIDGKGSDDVDKYPFGNYEPQDSGVYAAFGVIILSQEIWSKIPKANDFITKITKENPNQNFFYMAEKDEKWKGVGDVISEMRRLTVGEYRGLSDAGNGSESLARNIAHHQGLLERKSQDDWSMVVKKGKEKEYQEILKKSDWRDYYYPFIYDHKKKSRDEIYLEGKGLLILQKISDGKTWKADKSKSQEFNSGGSFKINDKVFTPTSDTTGKMLFYNLKTKELILPAHGYGIFLK